jgi:hypothetical protein
MREELASDRYDHSFGSSPPLSLGVEEELLLVDERRCLVGEGELVVVPNNVVHPGLLEGWGCRSHHPTRRTPDEDPR